MSPRVLKSTIVIDDQAQERADRQQTAVAEAYERGRADGAREATGHLDEAAVALAASLEAQRDEAIGRLVESRAADADLIVELALGLAEWYLAAAVADVRAELAEALSAAVTSLDQQADLVVTLAPETAELLEGVTQLPVRPDPSLGPADFRLIGDESTIERSWHEATERIRPALVAAIAESRRGR